MSTRTRRDWILWAQLGCALVATAHAEYTLATAVHLNEYVALAVPGALDLYVVRALQKRKDVLPAVLVMVAANIASILVAAGVLPLHWALYSAVGALAPLLVWRGHVLRVHADTDPDTAPDTGEYSAPAVGSTAEYDAPDYIPAWVSEQVQTDTPEYAQQTMRIHLSGCDGAHPDGMLCATYLKGAPAPPELPPGYDRVGGLTEDEWTELSDADKEYVPEANEYVHSNETHTIRGLRDALGVGQPRAERLIKHLKKEGVW